MITFLIIYAIAAAATLVFATVQNGKEMAYLRVLAPQNMLTPNWVNFFFLGLMWFAYWPQYFSTNRVTDALPKNPQQRMNAAARAMGLPTQDGPRG